MASIFTYQEEPPRVHSPWSTPGHGTPKRGPSLSSLQHVAGGSYTTSVTRLEPERQEGPTEYKLHLLLRVRGSLPVTGSLAKESRQARLQQLTTQLLWRLQQSSPFHSSSNANLVLPVLPDATPRLGVPDRPAKLLPGLEESQGALYEIGVADDGTLVGLVEEELEESLTNLRVMAASLGCVVDILKRVTVSRADNLGLRDQNLLVTKPKFYVAEVLVRPDTLGHRAPIPEESDRSTPASDTSDRVPSPVTGAPTPQMRVTFIGASAAGKSSLVGTLTSSVLDNGRGKSRLALLKHRHEISSGITSSVTQELIGYHGNELEDVTVVNYASGDISSWPDIHGLSSRLVFLFDSPGLPRYAKSSFRSLVSWDPHWTLLCMSANEGDHDGLVAHGDASAPCNSLDPASGSTQEASGISLTHLDTCLKLNKRLIIIVTKMDRAVKSRLKATLSTVLTALKQAGKSPILLSAPASASISTDESLDIASHLSKLTTPEVSQLGSTLRTIAMDIDNNSVPIVLTSAVTGAGLGKLHALLKELPIFPRTSGDAFSTPGAVLIHAKFHIDELFAIPPSRVYSAHQGESADDHGVVLCGHLADGSLSVGDRLRLGPFWLDHDITANDSGEGSPRLGSASHENGRRSFPRALSGEFSKSLQVERIKIHDAAFEANFAFIDVSVVSLRSLRLPVRTMHRGEAGTVGIQPVDPSSKIPLSRARKGMILTSQPASHLMAYRTVTAAFNNSDFSSMESAPLILGGHATVYVNSIRTAVKVTAMRLDEEDVGSEPNSPTDMFSFDAEGTSIDSRSQQQMVRITFKFVSSVERVELNDQILVVPTGVTAGPVSGPFTAMVTGISGYVGRVVEVSP